MLQKNYLKSEFGNLQGGVPRKVGQIAYFCLLKNEGCRLRYLLWIKRCIQDS